MSFDASNLVHDDNWAVMVENDKKEKYRTKVDNDDDFLTETICLSCRITL